MRLRVVDAPSEQLRVFPRSTASRACRRARTARARPCASRCSSPQWRRAGPPRGARRRASAARERDRARDARAATASCSTQLPSSSSISTAHAHDLLAARRSCRCARARTPGARASPPPSPRTRLASASGHSRERLVDHAMAVALVAPGDEIPDRVAGRQRAADRARARARCRRSSPPSCARTRRPPAAPGRRARSPTGSARLRVWPAARPASCVQRSSQAADPAPAVRRQDVHERRAAPRAAGRRRRARRRRGPRSCRARGPCSAACTTATKSSALGQSPRRRRGARTPARRVRPRSASPGASGAVVQVAHRSPPA